MKNIKLFIFDVDNTITIGTSIWEMMHYECNTWESYGKKYLEQFLNNEFDFDEFARLDVDVWKDQPVEKLTSAIEKVKIRTGFKEFVKFLKKQRILTALVSSTIGQFATQIANTHKINYLFANKLGTENKVFNGKIDITVPGEGKGVVTKNLMDNLGLKAEQVAAVGDSHFDFPMLDEVHHSFIMSNKEHADNAKYFV